MIETLLLKFRRRDDLSPEEADILAGVFSREERFVAGELIIRADVPQTESRLLIDGVAARAKLLPDGGRQITELHITGDFIDLHSFLLKKLDHDVVAMSNVRLAVAPHDRLRRITETQPHLTRLLWFSTLMDAAIHREWIVSAGRRSALQQMAHLLCEMLVRYQIVGMGSRGRCPLPLTQQQLADACGISAVHVNRVLQDLRAEGLVDVRRSELTVLDFDRLAYLAGFDPTYLMLEKTPR